MCKYGCGNIGKYKFKTVDGMCCSDYWIKYPPKFVKYQKIIIE